MSFPLKLTGISIDVKHHAELLDKRPELAWIEVTSDHYLVDGGPLLVDLKKLRQLYPLSLHGKGLSLGSTDELNWRYLKKLNNLIADTQPALISDHLSWSSFDGRHFHDFFPLPFTEEALSHVIQRLQQVEDYLQKQILIENIPHYFPYPSSTFTEWEFIKQIALDTQCGILLNINHLYTSSHYCHFDPFVYLEEIPPQLVQEIHLIGSPDQSIWNLYQYAIQRLGIKPTMIEYHPQLLLPSLEDLCAYAVLAENIMRETYAARKLTG